MTSQAADTFRQKFDRPIFIVSSPRAGSTLLFETIAKAPDVYTTGSESHQLIEKIEGLHPKAKDWESNRLTAEDATPAVIEKLSERFYKRLKNRDGAAPNGRIRMIEKTPKNSLRIPFLLKVYPDAQFLYLYRDARPTLSSMIEAWSDGTFCTYPKLVWPRTNVQWALLLTPGWKDWAKLPLPEIIARQWATTTQILLDDLAALPSDRVAAITYTDFLKSPQANLERVCASFGVQWDKPLDSPLPLSKTTVSNPSEDKWRKNEAVIESVWPVVEAVDTRAQAALKSFIR